MYNDVEKDIESVLLTQEQIRQKVSEMVRRIDSDYRGKELVMIAVLKGSVLFLADLVRGFKRPLEFDFIGVSSYEGGKVSTGVVRLDKEIAIDIKGKNVLVVDDILDTGRTLGFVKHYLQKFEPNEIKICVLVNKEIKRAIDVEADYWGFKIPNVFIVGYGMDFENHYRHLPYIGILKR